MSTLLERSRPVQDDTNSGVTRFALPESFSISPGQRFARATILVGVVVAGLVVAGLAGAIKPAALRLLVLLFAGQWLFSGLAIWRGRDSLFADRAYLAVNGLALLAREIYQSLKQRAWTTRELPTPERVSLLFWIVKLIFIPFLVGVASNQADYLVPMVISGQFTRIVSTFAGAYLFWLLFIDILDTTVGTLGYTIESKSFDNTVRSVDTSVVGWAAALCCYPPCWVITNTLIPIDTSPYFDVSSVNSTGDIAFRLLVGVFLTLFTVSTLNLNLHFSNLCHRGLVTEGLYGLVRHPAYSCKLISWGLILAYVSGLNLTMWLYFGAWVAIYTLRAITEERHLARVDSEYRKYMKRVRYRFIPGIV